MSTNIGYTTLAVIPTTKGFSKALTTQITPGMAAAGKEGGTAYGKNMLQYAKGFVAPLVGLFAAVKIIGIFKDSIKGASDLHESINALDVVYGKNAKAVEKMGKTSATAFGLSNLEFNNMAVMFANFTTTIAGKGGDVSKTLKELTGRASDFASVMNLSVADAASLFQSTLAGQSRPIRQYGIDISAVAVANYAMAHGIAVSAASMTEAQKVQARYGLLMQETSKDQGDFRNTSTALANASRIMSSEWKNISASLGALVLPALAKVTVGIGHFFSGIMDGTGAGGRFKQIVLDIYNDAFKPFFGFLTRNSKLIINLVKDLGLMYAAFKILNIVTKVSTGISLFAVAVKDGTIALKAMYAWEALVATLNPFGWVALAITGLVLLNSELGKLGTDHGGEASTITGRQSLAGIKAGLAALPVTVQHKTGIAGPHDKSLNIQSNAAANAANAAKAAADSKIADAAAKKAADAAKAAAAAQKILDGLKIESAVEDQKKIMSDFSRWIKNDFIASFADSSVKAADIISNIVSQMGTAIAGYAATISDPVKSAKFSLGASKIQNAMETKLFGYQTKLDGFNQQRQDLATQITAAESDLKSAISLRDTAATSIAKLLLTPFGTPSELTKAFSGATGTVDSILSGYDNLVQLVTDRFASITGGKKDLLLSFLKSQTQELVKLATTRSGIVDSLKTAQTAFETAQSTATSYADSLSTSLKSSSNSLSGFVTSATLWNGLTVQMAASPASLIKAFAARLTALKNFASNIKSLAARGLGQDILDQITGMGAESGGALAASLAAASDAQLTELQKSSDDITATAKDLGSNLSDTFYANGVSSAQAIRDGLQSKQDAIDLQMTSITSSITDILSPLTDSTRAIGTDTAQALLDSLKSKDAEILGWVKGIGAQIAQIFADALVGLNTLSGGANFAAGDAKEAAAKLAKDAADAAAAADAARKKALDELNKGKPTGDFVKDIAAQIDEMSNMKTDTADEALAYAQRAEELAKQNLAALGLLNETLAGQAKQQQTLIRAGVPHGAVL